jgi:hypothetical protein
LARQRQFTVTVTEGRTDHGGVHLHDSVTVIHVGDEGSGGGQRQHGEGGESDA